jgi:hypothetical protein
VVVYKKERWLRLALDHLLLFSALSNQAEMVKAVNDTGGIVILTEIEAGFTFEFFKLVGIITHHQAAGLAKEHVRVIAGISGDHDVAGRKPIFVDDIINGFAF